MVKNWSCFNSDWGINYYCCFFERTTNINIKRDAENYNNVIPTQMDKLSNATKVSLIYPKNNSQVDRYTRIKGRVRNLPPNFSLWAYVYAPGIKKYYLRKVINFFKDGSWESDLVIGAKGDFGYRFEVGVIVVDQDGSKYISNNGDKGLSLLPPNKKTRKIVSRKKRK